MNKYLIPSLLLLSACGASVERPRPTNPAPAAPAYTIPASLIDVSKSAATVADVAVSETPAPAEDTCLVILKRTPLQQIATLDRASCAGRTVFLAFRHAANEAPYLYYGISTEPGSKAIAALDVLVSREDGGLIVSEIGTLAGLPVWSH